MLREEIPQVVSRSIQEWIDGLDEVRQTKEQLFHELQAAERIQYNDGTWDVVLPSLGHLSVPCNPSFQWDDLTVRLIDDPELPGDMAAGGVVFSPPEV